MFTVQKLVIKIDDEGIEISMEVGNKQRRFVFADSDTDEQPVPHTERVVPPEPEEQAPVAASVPPPAVVTYATHEDAAKSPEQPTFAALKRFINAPVERAKRPGRANLSGARNAKGQYVSYNPAPAPPVAVEPPITVAPVEATLAAVAPAVVAPAVAVSVAKPSAPKGRVRLSEAERKALKSVKSSDDPGNGRCRRSAAGRVRSCI